MTESKHDLKALLPYATDRQQEYVLKYIELGSQSKVAQHFDVNIRSLERSLEALRKRAASRGWSPDHDLVHPTAPGQVLRGTSTLYHPEKGVVAQWVKTREDREQTAEMIRQAAEAMTEDLPEIVVSDGPKDAENDIIPWINIGDAHIGMVAHEAETGANFDLKIAERELCEAISILIDETGEHERCVINDLGDATHYENFAGVTEASGHALDYDGRFPKMIKVYVRIMRFIVEKALEKFQNVDVIVNQGNHSRTNDIWMAELLKAAYGHTGRVNILNNDSVFIAYRMGNTLVMTHHSDKCKPDRLANVMATDFRRDWGETEYHYIDIGHIHHRMTSKEHPGVMVESFNILANMDKYAHDAGYRSRQSITVIERSRTYGELGRRTLPIQRVRDAIREKCDGSNYEPGPKRAYVV